MKRALVIGRARGVWHEINQVLWALPYAWIIAVNKIGCDLPCHVDHWVSYHGYHFEDWIVERKSNGHPEVNSFWTSYVGRRKSEWEKKNKPHTLKMDNGGSSGLLGVLVADQLQADEIVLAGIPLEASRGHYDEEGQWAEANRMRLPWYNLDKGLTTRIRSLSGWTREMFGVPEWLKC